MTKTHNPTQYMQDNYPTLSAHVAGQLCDQVTAKVDIVMAGPQAGKVSQNRAAEVAAAMVIDRWFIEYEALRADSHPEAQDLFEYIDEVIEANGTPQATLMDLTGSRTLLDDRWLYQARQLMFAPNYQGRYPWE